MTCCQQFASTTGLQVLKQKHGEGGAEMGSVGGEGKVTQIYSELDTRIRDEKSELPSHSDVIKWGVQMHSNPEQISGFPGKYVIFVLGSSFAVLIYSANIY